MALVELEWIANYACQLGPATKHCSLTRLNEKGKDGLARLRISKKVTKRPYHTASAGLRRYRTSWRQLAARKPLSMRRPMA